MRSKFTSALIFSIIFLSFNGVSQNLNTSIDYISRKLLTCEGAGLSHSLSGVRLSDDGCYYSIKFESEQYKTWEYRFRFEDLDPNNIVIKTNVNGQKYLYVGTLVNDDLIRVVYPRSKKNRSFFTKDNSVLIVNENIETLERLQKAFINAIQLSNVKDPFL